MMLLHTLWRDGELGLWGEIPLSSPVGELQKNEAHTSAARPGTSVVPQHPFEAGGRLVEAWRSFLGTLKQEFPRRWPLQGHPVVLPSLSQSPLPSSSLLGELPPSRGKPAVRLRPWKVTLLFQDVRDALPWLLALPPDILGGGGVVLGPDVRCWAAAARFALSLAGRGRFLPDLDLRSSEEPRALWTPVFTGEDRSLLARLAKAMPAGARTPGKGEQAPAAESVLRDFLVRAVDELVRSALPAGRSRDAASADASWRAALCRADDPTLGGTREGRRDLAHRLRQWRRPLDLMASSPWRLAFRLEEPEAPSTEEEGASDGTLSGGAEPERGWMVRYLLQSLEDPSLLLPVASAWEEDVSAVGADPREYILTALGQAGRFCPAVEQELREGRWEGHDLDVPGALTFLETQAPSLEEAGFAVLAPGWWRQGHSRRRLGVRARATGRTLAGPGGMGMDDLVDVRWEAVLGSTPMTLEELEELARLKRSLVRFRGEWVHLSPEELGACVDLLRKGGGRMPVREVLHLELGAVPPPGGLAFEGVHGEGALEELFRALASAEGVDELPEPEHFSGTLRPYQRRGFGWLAFLTRWGLGACLADDMGLGKTIQTLALLQRHKNAGGKPVLLVCPTSVIENWRRELERFAPHLRYLIHHSLGRKKGADFIRHCAAVDVVFTSYALLGRDAPILGEVTWGGVVLDEAQNIKNPETRTAQAARQLVAGFRVALTGTPVENNVGDLWSLFAFLNPGLLGSRAAFERRYLTPIQRGQDREAADRLRRLSGPFVLRRLKTDRTLVEELPEKVERDVFCHLTREQASLYRAVTEETAEALATADGVALRGLALGTMMRLKQICNHPAHFLKENGPLEGRSGKTERLGEILEEVLAVDDRILIFTQFAEMGELLRRYVGERFGQEASFLHGGVPRTRRDAMVARFQEDPLGPRVFILSLKAGGTGLNLTRAHHVVLYDRWWNPAVETQAVDRAFRIGQNRNVQVHRFLCAGTLEEKIAALLARKNALAALTVSSGDRWLASLSAAELRQLLALEKGAVEG